MSNKVPSTLPVDSLTSHISWCDRIWRLQHSVNYLGQKCSGYKSSLIYRQTRGSRSKPRRLDNLSSCLFNPYLIQKHARWYYRINKIWDWTDCSSSKWLHIIRLVLYWELLVLMMGTWNASNTSLSAIRYVPSFLYKSGQRQTDRHGVYRQMIDNYAVYWILNFRGKRQVVLK